MPALHALLDAAGAADRSPSKRIAPRRTAARPSARSAASILPAPLGPITVTMLPGAARRCDTPCTRLDACRSATRRRSSSLRAAASCAHQRTPPEIGLEHRRILLHLVGVPSASLVPKSITTRRSVSAHHEVHVVLDQQDRSCLRRAVGAAARRAPASPDSAARPPARRAAAASDRRHSARAISTMRCWPSARLPAGGPRARPARRARAGAPPRRAAAPPRRGPAAAAPRSAPGVAAQMRAERHVLEHRHAGTSFTCWKVRAMPRRAIAARTQAHRSRSPRNSTLPAVRLVARRSARLNVVRLAGAVRTDQPDDLAGVTAKLDIVDRDQAAELLARRATVSTGSPRGGLARVAAIRRASGRCAAGSRGGRARERPDALAARTAAPAPSARRTRSISKLPLRRRAASAAGPAASPAAP